VNGVNIALGYGLASYLGLAFYYVGYSETQWRAPLGIALVWPFMMIFVCWLAPESPRWLLMNGQIEKAKEVTFKLHTIKGDPDQEFARGEFYQMSKQAELDRKMEPGWVSTGCMFGVISADKTLDGTFQTSVVSQALSYGHGLRVYWTVNWRAVENGIRSVYKKVKRD
jgi:MFS family permease